MNDAYKKLKESYDAIDKLIEDGVNCSSPEFVAWSTKVERALIKAFGENGIEHQKFKNTSFSVQVFSFNTPDQAWVDACARGLRQTKAILEIYLEDIPTENDCGLNVANEEDANYDKVFIVHGHDGEIKESVARLLERQHIKPIILSEQANHGKTIIEKFEANSSVPCAICLFTNDDEGKEHTELDYKYRARQNVVFEAGYFIGKLQRENVVILADDGLELPSDLQGVVYVNRNNWKLDLLKELKKM